MAVFKSKLGRKKEAAIIALLTARSIEEAARQAGVGLRTLYRWLKEEDFDAAYRDAKRKAFGQAIARLQQMCSAAVSTLGKIMIDTNAPASTRVRAAECVVNLSAKGIELEDVEARVAKLEQAAEETKKR
jgi:hypothetical protein